MTVNMGSPTGWHSAAASAPQRAFKMQTISRAKRSAAMPGWAAAAVTVHKLQIVYLSLRNAMKCPLLGHFGAIRCAFDSLLTRIAS